MPENVIAALCFGAVIYYALAWNIFFLVSICALFNKAEQPWWAALVPFYNVIVYLEIVGRPWWWFVLLLIASPLVIPQMIMGLILAIDLAHVFDRGVAFGIGLALLPPLFVPLLAFGEDDYVGHVTR